MFFYERIKQALKDLIDKSMSFKLVMKAMGVASIIMLIGTVFIARLLMQAQFRALETRGREMGQFLGRAVTDPLLLRDVVALDGLVAEAVKSPDMLYTYVADSGSVILNNAYTSFNRTQPEVLAFLERERSDDIAILTAHARDKLYSIEVPVDIRIGNTRLGSVTMGFSRTAVRKETLGIILLLGLTSLLIIFALAAMIYLMVRKMVVIPTSEAVAVASNVASGDLSQSVRVSSMNEIGMLGRGLNRMIIGLKGMIANVREAAGKTDTVWREVKDISDEISSGSNVQAESVEEAASSVNEMHFSLKEIVGSVDDLSSTSEQTSSAVIEMVASIHEVARTMTELSASIEETSAAIAQMSAAVRQIAENVEALSTAAEDTAASASEISASVKEVESHANESASLAEIVASDAQQLGMRSIEKTLDGMKRIESTTRRTADAMNRLGERAESIGSIVTVIEDITDQTGLLALNAAILAAQAGEHGRGFAVVAAEIRELANRTTSSTKEITQLIGSVQEETRDAIGIMREEVTLVEEGVRLAYETREALEKIRERADVSLDMSRSINKAASEQARGIKHVSDAVDKINAMTRQIARASQEQKNGSQQIIRAAERMRELTRLAAGATDVQSKESKGITAAVENMSTKIRMVNRATGEVQAGSDMIVKAIDRIKGIARSNAELAAGLHVAMEVMIKQSEALGREIGKFRI